jgi:hypothetical protein
LECKNFIGIVPEFQRKNTGFRKKKKTSTPKEALRISGDVDIEFNHANWEWDFYLRKVYIETVPI